MPRPGSRRHYWARARPRVSVRVSLHPCILARGLACRCGLSICRVCKPHSGVVGCVGSVPLCAGAAWRCRRAIATDGAISGRGGAEADGDGAGGPSRCAPRRRPALAPRGRSVSSASSARRWERVTGALRGHRVLDVLLWAPRELRLRPMPCLQRPAALGSCPGCAVRLRSAVGKTAPRVVLGSVSCFHSGLLWRSAA